MADQTNDVRRTQRVGREVRDLVNTERLSGPVSYIPIDQRVIDWLNEQFQETRPMDPKHHSSEQLWFREGQRSIIALLQRRHDSQIELDRKLTK